VLFGFGPIVGFWNEDPGDELSSGMRELFVRRDLTVFGDFSMVIIPQKIHEAEGITFQRCQYRSKTVQTKTVSQRIDQSEGNYKVDDTTS
jgi:hypothetical protein